MIKVTYNGKKTQIAEGKSATLPCYGKRMKSDVTVSGDTFAYVRYGPSTRVALEQGKTVTLACDGLVMTTDLFVDADLCHIKVYGSDNTTLIKELVVQPNVTVTFQREQPFPSSLKLSFNGSESSSLYSLDRDYAGVSDDIAHPVAKYKDGESFTLQGYQTHALYMRWTAWYVTLYGLGKDGVVCPLNSERQTWSAWVNNPSCNLIGAQIMDRHVYDSDGTRILCDSEGVPLNEDGTATNGGEYTFVDT